MSDDNAPKPIEGLPPVTPATPNPFARPTVVVPNPAQPRPAPPSADNPFNPFTQEMPAPAVNQPLVPLPADAGTEAMPLAAAAPTPQPVTPQPVTPQPHTPIPGAPVVAGRATSLRGGIPPEVAVLTKAFSELQRGVKRLIFNKHRLDEYTSYLTPAYEQLQQILAERGQIELRAEVSTLVSGDTPVLEDDKRENNLIYPLWNEGVRILTFRQDLTVKDLLRFITVVLDIFPRDPSEDLLSALWKAELKGIEWVALDDFTIVAGDDDDAAAEVEVQVEDVLAFIKRSLSSESEDGIGNARINLSDLELKLTDVSALKQLERGAPLYSADYKAMIQSELVAEESRLLDKICSVIFEVMQLEATDDELEDIAAALEQLLDGLVLQGKYGTINRVITFAEELSYQAGASTANRDLGRRISERLQSLITQPERVRGIATSLNGGGGQSLDELKTYLARLGPASAVMLLEMMDMLQNPLHRRVVADALVEIGGNAVPLFAGRIKKASSNLAKDLFYIIDQIDPPDKASILEPILSHENAVLRMEVMNLLSKAHDAHALKLVARVFREHEIPQMRAHAARVMGSFPETMVIKDLIDAARAEDFDQRPVMEQRSLLATLAQMEHPSAREIIRSILDEKSGLLRSRKIDERKLLLIKAVAGQSGIPALKMLSDIVAAKSKHSKEVLEAARDAALKMRDRMQGGQS